MKENWYALCVAILSITPLTVEEAFQKLDKFKMSRKSKYTLEDLEYMYVLRGQGIKLKKIGEIYGTSGSSICHTLRRYKEVHGLC